MFGVLVAVLFVIWQGKHPREDWEIPVYVFMAGGIAMGVIGLWAQKNTSIVSWGRKKAIKEEEN